MKMQDTSGPTSSQARCCHPPAGDQLPVHEAGLDLFEVAVLDIMRFYFLSFADPASQGWLRAMHTATTHFKAEAAPIIAFQILAMVQAMRCSRASVFIFSSPVCPECSAMLSDEERHMMAAIHCIRCGRPNEARTHAMLLCQGNPTETFLMAVDALCAGAPHLTMRHQPTGV
ncbi:MAG: hypothetical protein AAF848_02100 [Pseudomonadota bacterium]